MKPIFFYLPAYTVWLFNIFIQRNNNPLASCKVAIVPYRKDT